MLGKTFDDDAQERSREEKTQGILEGYLILVSSSCLMPFEVHQVMNYSEKHELVEEHDEDKSRVG